MPANSDISTWSPPYSVPAVDAATATVPLAMYRDIVDRWGEAQAEAAGLRAMLDDAGVPTPDTPGNMTLRRVRDYERVRYLAREYVYHPTDEMRQRLMDAIAASEVSP